MGNRNYCKKLKGIGFLIVFIFSTLTTHSDVLNYYSGNTVPVLLKLILIIAFLGVFTFINADNEDIIAKYPPVILNTVLVLYIIDYYFTNFSGTNQLYKLMWLACIFVAQATLFLIITLTKPKFYSKFYNRFWKGFTPTYIFSFIICFIRRPNCIERTVNYIPFKRSMGFLINFFKNPTGTFENPLYFFGNIIFFIPIPFILRSFFPKLKDKFVLLIGFIIPILIESYQYFLSCGDVDIDDLMLNWLGLGIGFIIKKCIRKKLLQNL